MGTNTSNHKPAANSTGGMVDWQARQFGVMDANGDGIISQSEFLRKSRSPTAMNSFNQLDSNHDGVISREELLAAGRGSQGQGYSAPGAGYGATNPGYGNQGGG